MLLMIILDDVEIGKHLKNVILKKYNSIRQFCKAYLELKDGSTNDEEIRKLLNRFSQILKGEKKHIQISDLPFVTELLGISCEEILSAGKEHLPVHNHITNYGIAFSHDKAVWDRYMKREDKLFLNCDEYGKSVIDYALDFKNYEFIKYLLDEKYIWFVDLSKWDGYSYGAGTSIKPRNIRNIDTHTPLEIQYQDKLRTQTIALAIENEDLDILDSLLAREIPEMRQVKMYGNSQIDFQSHRNDELICAIALSNDKIIDYYSQEFVVKNQFDKENTFLYPYCDAIIKIMLENGKTDSAERLIRRAIEHNKNAFAELKKLKEEASKQGATDTNMKVCFEQGKLDDFCFVPNSNLISFFYCGPDKHQNNGMVTNIIHIENKFCTPLIRKLLDELNDTFTKIIALKGDAQ